MAHRRRAGIVVILLAASLTGWRADRPRAAEIGDVAVLGGEEGETLPLPSVAARFGTFDEVSAAVRADRERIATLESRLARLERDGEAGPSETLPEPAAATGQPSTGAAATQSGPYEVGSDRKTSTSWADGFLAQSAHKDFRVKIGGRTQVDAVAFSAGAGPNEPPDEGGVAPELADTVDLRRARLRVEGRMYEVYDWACEYDFVNQINVNNERYPTERDSGPLTAVTDLWLQVRELPLLGIVRIGNQKDPFGYEHLTSSRWLNFMERSFNQDAFEGPFNNGFLPGIQVFNNNEAGDFAWQVGEFKNTSNPFGFSNSSGGSMTVGRVVWLPVFEDDGRKLLHLGLSGRTMEPRRQYTAFDPVSGLPIGDPINAVRFRSRGSIRNGPPGPLNSIYADAGLLEGTWQNMIGLEFVGNNGPWSFQSEYFGSWLYNARTTGVGAPGTVGQQPPKGTPVGTVYYQGGYAEVLYFLTGESRTYSRLEYRFDRPVPHNNFYAIRGGGSGRRLAVSEGAWQVGVRYNYLCLSDGEVNGGVLNGMTLGLNWMLNPNARLYFNYDFTYRDFVNVAGRNGSGGINGFGTRLAFDF